MDFSAPLDMLLDRSIALGYGTFGIEARKRLRGWPSELPRMDGKVVLVTGAASGIGLSCAIGFAALGARVLASARSERRAGDAVEQIQESVAGADATPLAADVSSLAEIRALAGRLSDEEPRLDVLVNNAGTMPDERRRSADGHELMFATHVLGPFALTRLLGDLMGRSAPSRVINVSSGGMYSQGLHADDLEADRAAYSPARIYARTKRQEVILSEMLAERMAGSGVFVNAMHPGWVDTAGIQAALPAFRSLTRAIIRTPEQGADTIVWLGAAAPGGERSGLFWMDRRPRPTHYLIGAGTESAADRRALWDYCRTALERSATATATAPGAA
jgi:dehydrogenase/reductase SDR family protein 12